MIVPNSPSWPTTSYNGECLTNISSVALAVRPSASDVLVKLLQVAKEPALTEPIEGRTEQHEEVSLDHIHRGIVLVRVVVGNDFDGESQQRNKDAQELGPVVSRSLPDPLEEHADRNRPTERLLINCPSSWNTVDQTYQSSSIHDSSVVY